VEPELFPPDATIASSFVNIEPKTTVGSMQSSKKAPAAAAGGSSSESAWINSSD
jgi:hypothetical protein